ncbi:2-amino-4-hydroxy-6-hydroxymethyldihydropteridine diphosphokinase [Celerinatantimonas yamalensis]|uniref:2-amino-4-hydroxy-6-hydroxymethyldihydropteridine diphosphokinase n=1 Tax=Celerinatantimonas yamalensis TaxID=559956 RepID=A0ABW9G5I6_9GAMM
MAQVYVGIGSNIDREFSIAKGIGLIEELIAHVRCSPVYQSKALGFNGPDFYNLVGAFETSLTLTVLAEQLRFIEYRCGRPKQAHKCSSRMLDIDLLLYDDVICDTPCVLPRPEICMNAFVLRPLAELAGDKRHPITGVSLQQMWLQLAPNNSSPLTRVDDSFLTQMSDAYDHPTRNYPLPHSGVY